MELGSLPQGTQNSFGLEVGLMLRWVDHSFGNVLFCEQFLTEINDFTLQLDLGAKGKTLHCATLDAVEPWGNAVFKSTAKEWMS